DYVAAFVQGTEPQETCDQSNDQRGIFSKIFGLGPKPSAPGAVSNGNQSLYGQAAQNAPPQSAETEKKKKKGFWGRLFGGGDDDEKKDEKKKEEQPKIAPTATAPPKSPQ